MKSQDILLLFKMVSLSARDRTINEYRDRHRWQDWETSLTVEEDDGLGDSLHLDEIHLTTIPTYEESISAQYSVRALAAATGISKSQVSLALARCYANGLASIDRMTELPRVNIIAFGEFVVYGLKYVFPPVRGALTRGIGTAWAAPVLENTIVSGGEMPLVWPDGRGNTKGQALEPIYKTVPMAVRKDPMLYNFLALTDSIRAGQAREKAAATDLLIKALERHHV